MCASGVKTLSSASQSFVSIAHAYRTSRSLIASRSRSSLGVAAHESSGLGSAAPGLQLIASVNFVVTIGSLLFSFRHVVSVT